MPEPTSSTSASASVLVLSVGVLGPLLGPYAIIIVCSLAGALWALSRRNKQDRSRAALFVSLRVLTAVLLTGTAAFLIESKFEYKAQDTIAPIAFLLGYFGDRLFAPIEDLFNRTRTRIRGGTPPTAPGDLTGSQEEAKK